MSEKELPTLTIRQYLRRRNPSVTHSRRYDTTKSRTLTDYRIRMGTNLKSPSIYRDWKDFPSAYLPGDYYQAFSAILDTPVEETKFDDHSLMIREFPFQHIYDEDSVDALLVRWNQPVVCDALTLAHGLGAEEARKRGIPWPRVPIFMSRGGLAQFMPQGDGLPKIRRYPDWAGIRKVRDKDPNASGQFFTILPGETKVRRKWGSDDLNGISIRDDSSESPAVQIYNYCLAAGVPYGYIITEDELIPVHVDERSGQLEWFAIPWKVNNDDMLNYPMSVNECLWWLHMLALLHDEEDRRENRPAMSKHTPPINSASSSFNDQSPPKPKNKHELENEQRSPRQTRQRTQMDGPSANKRIRTEGPSTSRNTGTEDASTEINQAGVEDPRSPPSLPSRPKNKKGKGKQ